jgi:hypothetical protein
MLERIKAAIENPAPSTGDWRCCKCFKCERIMQDGEPIWRIRVGRPGFSILGWPKIKYSIEHFCRDCGSQAKYAHSQVACEFCKRPMHDAVVRSCGVLLRHYYCSRGCEISGTNARANAAARACRAEARGPSRECVVCGEVFETKRADAMFCSGACRQKAYRRRVTVSKRNV